jgi:hypothetical protein
MLYDRVADLALWISERRLLVPDAHTAGRDSVTTRIVFSI